MPTVHMDARKWPDRLHWQFPMQLMGEDRHGRWLHVPAGTVARRGDEPARPMKVGFVALVPEGAWWTVEFYTRHPSHAVYVNIGTPPVWDGDRVTQVDLDLDVVRGNDGSIAVLDEDEFAAHQVELGYPPKLVDGARAAAARAVGMLQRSDEPFGEAAGPWIEAASLR